MYPELLTKWFISNTLRGNWAGHVSHRQFRQRTGWYVLRGLSPYPSDDWFKLMKKIMIREWQSQVTNEYETLQAEFFVSFFSHSKNNLQSLLRCPHNEPLNCETGRPFKSHKEKQIRNVKTARTWHPASGLTVTILDLPLLTGNYHVDVRHSVDSNTARVQRC